MVREDERFRAAAICTQLDSTHSRLQELNYTRPHDERLVLGRTFVSTLQELGLLPERMSNRRYTDLGKAAATLLEWAAEQEGQ